MATLLQMSNKAIDRFGDINAARLEKVDFLSGVLQSFRKRLAVYTGPGKGPGDCLSNPVQVVDTP
jgi:hypothetical protein